MDLEFNQLKLSEESGETLSYDGSKSQTEEKVTSKSSQHPNVSNCSDEEVHNNEPSSRRCHDPDYLPFFEPEDLIGINSWFFRRQLEYAMNNLDPYYTGNLQHQAATSGVEIDVEDEDSDVDEAIEAVEEDFPFVRALLDLLRGDDDEDSVDENNNVEYDG
jgi:hypothetical protein